jgi:hypothetical protein
VTRYPAVLCLILMLGAAGIAIPTSTAAQEMSVTVDVQYPLLLKVLGYERNLERDQGMEFVIGILFQRRYRLSASVRDELLRVSTVGPPQTVRSRPVRWVPVDFRDIASLKADVLREKLAAIYVCPLRAVDIRQISQMSRDLGLISMSGVPEYVQAGLTLGLDLRDGRRPEILINVRAAREEGAQFSAQLLKLARIID